MTTYNYCRIVSQSVFESLYYCLIQTGYPISERKIARFPYVANIDEVTAQTTHSEEEIMAQSICTSITGIRGWSYAVERVCEESYHETCTQICESDKLRSQDPQTSAGA